MAITSAPGTCDPPFYSPNLYGSMQSMSFARDATRKAALRANVSARAATQPTQAALSLRSLLKNENWLDTYTIEGP